MTEYQVEIAEAAQLDLISSVKYIRDVLLEPIAAYDLYEEIKGEISRLNTMPERYPLWEDEPWHSAGLRKMVVRKYIVLYQVNHERKSVQVARVFYGGRDISAQLWEEVK